MDDVEVSARTASRFCSDCGADIVTGAAHCTRCLLELGLETAGINRYESDNGEYLRFGDYEIRSDSPQLEGGMGVVYRARQISLNRTVALKMIKGGILIRPEQVARFRAEAEAVASLDHPNIVSIYEIGEQDGRQYFTMKWFEGGSLSRWSLRSEVQPRSSEALPRSKSPKSAEAVATLVATVARAVHHAHQRGFIHRDLKPSNILLDAAGNPHVSDFGLVKRLHSGVQSTSSETELTSSGDTFGTPSYMAPEQAAGNARDVTTAADIYSLGAILYELLVGQPPFVAETAAATIHNVLTEEPKRPCAIKPETPRDIETICLKCLEKEPTRRYSSADAVAGDLSRWLRHEPIMARPAGVWKNVCKWARRNPVTSILSALLFLAVIAGADGTLWQLRQSQRNLRESEFARRLLKDTLRSLGRSVDLTVQREILQSSAERLEAELKLHPELDADLSEELGTIYASLGDLPRAEAMLRRALAVYSRESGLDPREVGLCLNTLGVVVQRQGRRAEAEPIYRESLRILTEILGAEASDLDVPRDNLAFLLRRLNKFSESEALYRQAWEITQKRFGKDSWQAAESVAPVVQVMLQQRKPAEAEPLAREALETLGESRPLDWQPFDLQSLLGGCLSDQKKFDQAGQLLLSGYEGLWDSGVTNFFVGRMKIGEALERLVRHFEIAGPPDKAVEWNQRFEQWSKVIEEYNAAAATPAGRSPH